MSCWPKLSELSWLNECKARLKAQEEIRAKINASSCFDESALRSLDSALKKTTAFMKKMKTLNSFAVPSLISDLSKLNLSKFVEEMAQAIAETKLKTSEVVTVVDLCVEIAIRYQNFSSLLLAEFKKMLPIKKSDKIANPSKLRIDLRFLCELILAGVFKKDGLQLFGAVITCLTTNDKVDHVNIGLLCSLFKPMGWSFAGMIPLPEEDAATVTIQENDLDSGPIIGDHKKIIHDMVADYYNSFRQKLEKKCVEMNAIQKKVKRQARTRGDATAEDKATLDEVRTSYDQFKAQGSELSSVLGIKMPQLKEEPSDDEEDELANIEMSKALAEGEVSLWPDDETEAFYCNLLNIKNIVPKNLYKESEERTLSLNAMKTCVDSVNVDGLDETLDEMQETLPEEVPVETVEGTEVTTEPTEEIKQNMAEFLQVLDHLVNREVTDNCALNFVQHLNTKGNRKRLVKTLLSTPGNRLDLIPFIARLLATLFPVMPDVVTEITNHLVKNFKDYMKIRDTKTSAVRVEEKLKCVVFIAELVKFELVPRAEALNCLRQLVYDFHGHWVDMACTMIEAVGFYLYRNSDSHSRMKILLSVMMNKKEKMKDTRQRMLVDNSYYAAVPSPEGSTKVVETAPPMHLFVKQTILLVNGDNVNCVLKLLRRIDWNDQDLLQLTLKYLSSPWLVPYSNLCYLASVVAGMTKLPAHDWITVSVVDSICETVRLSLEAAGLFNQQAMASITFLGEIYNYNGCESGIIFKILYQLITFPEDHAENWMDFYRLRMICEMVNVVGEFFMSSSSKKKMDYFLMYFFRYYWIKRTKWEKNIESTDSESVKFPPEVESEFRNCIKYVRRNAAVPDSLEEAERNLEVVEQKLKLDFSELEVEEDEDTRREPVDRSLHQIQEEEEMGDDEFNEEMSSASHNAPFINQAEDEEFTRELDRLINETHRNAPTQAPGGMIDMTVSVAAKQKLQGITFADDSASSSNVNSAKPVKVALLARGRGNKAQLKAVAITTEKLHNQWKVEKERQLKEQEDIKRVTLDHSARIMADELKEREANAYQKRHQTTKY
ncbi:unnamed protein product [Auanema sp. JU1783]|nr:unnamed protein product [Auanema sp. JU1783]